MINNVPRCPSRGSSQYNREKIGMLMKAVMFKLDIWKAILRKLRIASKLILAKYKADWPDPVIQHTNQVKIKTIMCGICASDHHMLAIDTSYFPSITSSLNKIIPMGHEILGVVTEIGAGVASIQPGDRVVVNPARRCEMFGFAPCTSCLRGNWAGCRTLAGIGDGSDREKEYGGKQGIAGVTGGGFGEQIVAFEQQLYKVPDNVPDDVAVLAEPFAVGIHAVFRNPPSDDDVVLVFGAGIIGLLVIAAIRAFGSRCKIICIKRYDFQADAAKRLGADEIVHDGDRKRLYADIAEKTGALLLKPAMGKKAIFGGIGPAIIYDCVGTETSLDDAMHLVRYNGKIVIVGLAYSVTRHVDWAIPVYKETEIAGSLMYGMETFEGARTDDFSLAVQFLTADPGKYKGLVTHKFPIEKYKAALRTSMNKGRARAIKVVFSYNPGDTETLS